VREQRRGVAIRTQPQQDQIEARGLVTAKTKSLLQDAFIFLRSGSGVGILGWYAEDVLGIGCNQRQHSLLRHAVVAVRMIGRNVALVTPEESDLAPGNGS